MDRDERERPVGGADRLEELGTPRRIAIFGGSFNPPHVGHVYVMAHVLATQPLDELWMIPTHTHAFGKDLAPFDARLEMCRRVAEIFGERVVVSDIEARLFAPGRPSFTVETVSHLHRTLPNTEMALIVGSDALPHMNRWKDIDLLSRLTRTLVVHREGHPVEGAGPAIPNVSSTWVRQRLGMGQDVSGWVPIEVERLCANGGWYERAGQS